MKTIEWKEVDRGQHPPARVFTCNNHELIMDNKYAWRLEYGAWWTRAPPKRLKSEKAIKRWAAGVLLAEAKKQATRAKAEVELFEKLVMSCGG